MKKVFLLCLIFLAITVNGQKNTASEAYATAHKLVLSHQFESFETYSNNADLTDGERVYLNSLSEFMKLHLKGGETEFRNFITNTDKRLNIIDNFSNKEARFTQAVVLFQSSVSYGRFKQYLNAAVKFKKAYKLTHKLVQQYPDYMPAKMLYGTMLVIFGSTPDDFEWVLNLLNIEGQIQEGLIMLEEVFHHQYSMENPKYMEESLMLLTFAHCKFKPESDKLKKIYEYYQHPDIDGLITSCPLIRYNAVDLVKNLSDNEQALAYMQRAYPVYPDIPFYYLDYYLKGLSKLQKLNFNAKRYFEAYINQYPGDIYKKAAVQKLAWIALLENGKDGYEEKFEQINDFSFDAKGSDDAAQKEFDNNNRPNPYLLKVRLLFDGGYYKRALTQLVSYRPSHIYTSDKDRLEFIYRLARIHHKLTNYPKAITHYKMTVDIGKEKKFYFAANAALQLGIIYAEKNQYEKARNILEQCLEMDPESYKYGIHRKAKAQLKEIPAK
ncbi:MAG: tetratricopeptide repeat protein [Bacteroidales bacterium]|nr:tetratricopeptide repeat protein [Bacteroidales bacterium]MCF8327708.1 tetratricopeptide repeat protein [Bacteroidales bacterium]